MPIVPAPHAPKLAHRLIPSVSDVSFLSIDSRMPGSGNTIHIAAARREGGETERTTIQTTTTTMMTDHDVEDAHAPFTMGSQLRERALMPSRMPKAARNVSARPV